MSVFVEGEAPARTTAEITAALKVAIRERFGGNGHKVFFEVGNDTGARVKRWADAVSIGIWPSTGHAIHGFEVKASRSDWLREKNNPLKVAAVGQFCHRLSIVAAPGVLQPGELPPNFGLYLLTGDKLRESVIPHMNRTPEPVTAGFMAAVVRHEAAGIDAQMAQQMVEREKRTWEAQRDKQIERMVEDRVKRLTREGEEARKMLTELEHALGEKLPLYGIAELAAAIKLVRDAGVSNAYYSVTGLLNTLKQSVGRIETAVAAFDAKKQPDGEIS